MSGLIRLEQRKTERFKTIDLTAVDDDPRLSWKAKGIHTYLMTRPPKWEFYYADLLKRATDKRGAIKSGLKELQEAGYLKIRRDQDERGRWSGRTWIVTQDPKELPIESETPLFENTDGKQTSTVSRKTVLRENRNTENQQGSKKQGSNKHKEEKTSASKPRFPAEWYRQNETDYQEIKGVTLNGPEFGPFQRDLKLIYKAGHTPDEVRALMLALEKSEEAWTDSWTVKTVRMKIAEWKAGKLRLKNGRDEEKIKALRDDISEINHYLEYQVERRLIELGWAEEENGSLSEEQMEQQEKLERIRSQKEQEKMMLLKELSECERRRAK
jgi:hypothetical protein